MKRTLVLVASATLLCLACHSPATPPLAGTHTQNVQLADSLQLAFGKQVVVPGSSLAVTFNSLVQDSRCAPDVVCVWAGELVVDVIVEQQAAASPMGLADTLRFSSLNARSQVAFGYRFDLIAERPTHRSDEAIPPDAYWIAVRVVALGD